MYTQRQYDDILEWQSTNPNAPELTEKEKKDLELWKSIRKNEEILMHKIALQKLLEDKK
jgi:hypothetical protein